MESQDEAHEDNGNDEVATNTALEIKDIVENTGKHLDQHPVYDNIINAEVLLQHGDDMVTGKVA